MVVLFIFLGIFWVVSVEGHGACTILDGINSNSQCTGSIFFVSRDFFFSFLGTFLSWSTLNLIHAACTFWSVGLEKHNNNRWHAILILPPFLPLSLWQAHLWVRFVRARRGQVGRVKAWLHENWAAVEVQPRGPVLVLLPSVVVLILHLFYPSREKIKNKKKLCWKKRRGLITPIEKRFYLLSTSGGGKKKTVEKMARISLIDNTIVVATVTHPWRKTNKKKRFCWKNGMDQSLRSKKRLFDFAHR